MLPCGGAAIQKNEVSVKGKKKKIKEKEKYVAMIKICISLKHVGFLMGTPRGVNCLSAGPKMRIFSSSIFFFFA